MRSQIVGDELYQGNSCNGILPTVCQKAILTAAQGDAMLHVGTEGNVDDCLSLANTLLYPLKGCPKMAYEYVGLTREFRLSSFFSFPRDGLLTNGQNPLATRST